MRFPSVTASYKILKYGGEIFDYLVDSSGPLCVNYRAAGKGGGPDMIDHCIVCEVAET
jgi:hypothetical protein